MRPQRPFNYPLAFLTVAIGVTAAPAANRALAAGDDGIDAAVPAEASAAPAPPAPDIEPEPEPETTEPEPAPETTEPAPEPEPRPEPTTPPTTTPPLPEPEPATPPTTEAPEPEPTPEVPVVTEPEEPSTPADPPSDSPTSPDRPDDPDQPAEAEGIDGITRHISFPVLGTVQYANGWGDCRDGCARRHVGTDMLGVRMQPLLAAVDGTITRIHTDAGISGNGITVTGADGWYYNYFHVNNDTPGTDDGLAAPHWQVSPGLTVGSRVRAGQVIGYMGDSGNAEGSVPHLHFEIRTPDRTPVNPYHSLAAAQRRERRGTDAPTWTNTDLASLSPDAVAIILLAGGGRWVIDRDGRLYAEGPGAGVDSDAEQPSADEGRRALALAASVADPAPTPAITADPVADPAPTPAVTADPEPTTADRQWTVESGDSLWKIVQTSYETSDTEVTVALVDLVFDRNRDELTDPSVLEVGMTLTVPTLRF